jgi:hypothetical protein
VDFIVPADENLRQWQMVTRLPNPSDKVSLQELRDLADYINVIAAAVPIGKLETEVRISGSKFGGKITFGDPPDPEFLRLGVAIRAALSITGRLGIPSDILTSLNELFAQNAELELIDAALRAEILGIKVDFWAPIDDAVPSAGCLPMLYRARIGGHLIVLAGGYSGKIHRTGALEDSRQQYVLHPESLHLTYAQAFVPGKVPQHSPLELLCQAGDACPHSEILRWWEADDEPEGGDADRPIAG